MSHSKEASSGRIRSIDIMRGLVIILMMLDHVRERFYMHVRTGDPIHAWIEPDLFFTRFLTHFCAPTFIFLAGLSAWLYAHPKQGLHRVPTGFLLKRGLVIIAIEIVFYYLLWIDSYPSFLFLQVLFTIGVCMVALAFASRLPYVLIAILGFTIVFGHNLLTPIDLAPGDPGYVLWTILHDPGELGTVGGLTISLSYPVLPWFGVICLGYCAGPLYARTFDSVRRRKILLGLGAGCFGLLLLLRGFNIYGETLPWSAQGSALQTLMAFLNFTKYPPSLNYILMTLGACFWLLAAFEALKANALLRALRAFGAVPMFIYILHLYVLLGAYWILFALFGATHGERFGLSGVGWIWAGMVALVLALYPIAKLFADFKHREKSHRPWLSYL